MHDKSTHMLPVSSLRPARLPDLQIGELFTSFSEPRSKFIAGMIEEVPVVVMIEGEHAFDFDPPSKWDSADGWPGHAIKNVRFEVDAASITPMPPRLGMLVVSGSGAVFVATGGINKGLRGVRIDSADPAEAQLSDLAFSKWRIVCGSEDAPITLYSHG